MDGVCYYLVTPDNRQLRHVHQYRGLAKQAGGQLLFAVRVSTEPRLRDGLIQDSQTFAVCCGQSVIGRLIIEQDGVCLGHLRGVISGGMATKKLPHSVQHSIGLREMFHASKYEGGLITQS